MIYDRPSLFHSLTGLEPSIFIDYLLLPLFPVLNLPSDYWLHIDLNDDLDDIPYDLFKQRRCQIDKANKLFRYDDDAWYENNHM